MKGACLKSVLAFRFLGSEASQSEKNEWCSTSLPGGNQVDGLPPAASQILSG